MPFYLNDQNQKVNMNEGQTNQYLKDIKKADTKVSLAKKDMDDFKLMGSRLPKGSTQRERLKTLFEKAKVAYNKAVEDRNRIKPLQYDHKMGADVNVPLLKIKLKNMARQVKDYPELKGRIGGLNVKWNEQRGAYRQSTSEEVMAATTSANWRNEKIELTYDAYIDRDTPEGQRNRDRANANPDSIGNHLHNVGNHELGHGLASFLNESDEQHHRRQAESDILDTTLQQVIPNEYPNLPRVAANGNGKHQGQIDTENSDVLTNLNLTSNYGQSKPVEWFAEAFHDVYSKGSAAKPASIVMVKEYEKRMVEKQKSGFQKKKRGFFSNIFTKIGRFFSQFKNYGERHAPQQQAAQNANPAAAPQQAPAVVPQPQPQQVVNQAPVPQPIVNQAPVPQPQNNNLNVAPQPQIANPLPEIQNNIVNDNQLQNDDMLDHYANNMLEPDLIAQRGKKTIGKKKKKK